MCGMALLASHSVELVFGFIVQRLIVAGHMARQAPAGVLLRFSMEAKNQLLGSRDLLIVACRRFNGLNMSFAWPVAAFAAGAIFHVFRRCPGMNRFIE